MTLPPSKVAIFFAPESTLACGSAALQPKEASKTTPRKTETYNILFTKCLPKTTENLATF